MQAQADYFKDCKTEHETRKAFLHLSKILHPDLGGTCQLFRDMHEQYERKLKSLHGTYNNAQDAKEGKRKYQYDAKIERDLMEKIQALQGLRLPETVEIHLQGTWIWVKGTAKNNYGNYPIHGAHIVDQLERLGLKLHTMKGECYYRNNANKCFNKGKVMKFDRIASRYRGVRFDNTGADQLQ